MAAPGPRNLITDVPGLLVGSAHDEAVVTGVTVLFPEQAAVAGVDVRGGGPGTRETDSLLPENLVGRVDAVVLSGGSVYGLAAADAVTAVLGARGRGFRVRPDLLPAPIAPSAILFDLGNGGDKAWGESPPYARLGRQALAAASADFALGRAGAGYGARAGATWGGLGSASAVSQDGIAVGAIVAVNSFGSTRIPGTDVFWAWPLEQVWNGAPEAGGARPDARALAAAIDLEDWGAAKLDPRTLLGRANTTIAAVAVDAALTTAQAKRVAVMAQTGVARAVRPVHAPFDGDVVFALSTARRPLPEPAPLSVARLGALAADCLARAIMRGVSEAERQEGEARVAG